MTSKQVICRGLRKACEVAVARLDAVSVKPVDDDQVSHPTQAAKLGKENKNPRVQNAVHLFRSCR